MHDRLRAAIYIQFVFRKCRGKLAEHLIRQAHRRVKRRRIKRKTEIFRFPNTEARATCWSNLFEREYASMDNRVETTDWEVAWSEEYQCQYYYNKHTGISSWECPP